MDKDKHKHTKRPRSASTRRSAAISDSEPTDVAGGSSLEASSPGISGYYSDVLGPAPEVSDSPTGTDRRLPWMLRPLYGRNRDRLPAALTAMEGNAMRSFSASTNRSAATSDSAFTDVAGGGSLELSSPVIGAFYPDVPGPAPAVGIGESPAESGRELPSWVPPAEMPDTSSQGESSGVTPASRSTATSSQSSSDTSSGPAVRPRRPRVPEVVRELTPPFEEEEDLDPPPSPAIDTTGINANMIIPNILISDRIVAESEFVLRRLGVTHIVTVDTMPLDRGRFLEPDRFVMHYIEAKDTTEEDLLLKLPELFKALESAPRILFHCQLGRSRSVAVCTLYLMHRDKTPLDELGDIVTRARPQIQLNEGFMNQLELYARMGNDFNTSDISFQLYALTHTLFKLIQGRNEKSVSEQERMEFYRYLGAAEMNISCKRCRTYVSSSDRIVPHKSGEHQSWNKDFSLDETDEPDARPGTSQSGCHMYRNMSRRFWRSRRRLSRILEKYPLYKRERCDKSIFIVPGEQILAHVFRTFDDIRCVKCNAILGKYGWSEVQCRCEAKFFPGFLLYRRKVHIPKEPAVTEDPTSPDEKMKESQGGGGGGDDDEDDEKEEEEEEDYDDDDDDDDDYGDGDDYYYYDDPSAI